MYIFLLYVYCATILIIFFSRLILWGRRNPWVNVQNVYWLLSEHCRYYLYTISNDYMIVVAAKY